MGIGMKLLEWLRALREFVEWASSPEVTWDHKPIRPDKKRGEKNETARAQGLVLRRDLLFRTGSHGLDSDCRRKLYSRDAGFHSLRDCERGTVAAF
jgi:hypothetical protein